MVDSIKTDVLIVGAGLSGLMAANELSRRGLGVLLVDKGRSVGGRLATRRIGAGVADHGAQFFTVRAEAFSNYVEQWLADGLVYEWSRGWNDGSLAYTRDGHPRYAVHGGVNNLAQHLAGGLDARVKVRITDLKPTSDGWLAQDEAGNMYQAGAALLTPPVPQALALLDAGQVRLTAADRGALEKLDYAPCLTGLFWLEGDDSGMPPPGAVQRFKSNLSWIADNQRKGISPDAVIITAQASATYSRQLWDLPDERVLAAFKVDLLPFLVEEPTFVEAQLKRWRYSMPITLHIEPCLLAEGLAPLAFAGDAFHQARVEGAALSGLAAADALAQRLKI
jgi:hypothetical protein